MNLILSGRGVQLDDRLKAYATDKLTKVERFFDRIIKMEIELRRERNPRVADPSRVDVTVKTPRETLRATGEGADLFAAIDVAADRLERQLRRFKDRLTAHPHRDVVRNDGAPPSDDEPTGVVRIQQQIAKPISTEDALIELDERGLNFLLFTDADTMAAAVVYRRAGGGYGLIEHTG